MKNIHSMSIINCYYLYYIIKCLISALLLSIITADDSYNNNNQCIVTEEILISTFVCDLNFLFEKYAPKNTSSHLNNPIVVLNILNENQHFQIIDQYKLVTKGRIDREQYVYEKLCQNVNINNDNNNNNNGDNSFKDYSFTEDLIDDDPSLVDCTIILEFALISRNRTFKPILINLPVKIQDINDNIPRFDQYTSGLRLEVSEDISSTISKYYTIPSLVYLPTLLSSISHSSSTSSPTGYWKGNSFHATESALLHQNKKRELAVLPLAKDVDYGVNGTVAYRLEGPDAEYFELVNHTVEPSRTGHSSLHSTPRNIKSLHLISHLTLDREHKSEYRLILLAYDQSEQFQNRHTSQLPISIQLKEVNEYPPIFNLGINITTLQYGFNDQFTLNSDTKYIGHSNRFHPQVQIKSFSYHYSEVENGAQGGGATSGGVGGGQVASSVQLSDINYLILGIPEDINVGSRIYCVQAIDIDSIDFSTFTSKNTNQYPYQYQHYQEQHHQSIKHYPHNTVHYFIAQETDLVVKHYFRLGKEDGWITLIHQLDYETSRHAYILPIVAVDFGRPQLSSTLTLTIQVVDVNDEAPSISIRGIEPTNLANRYYHQLQKQQSTLLDNFSPGRFQILNVRENSPAGTFIAKVSARDRDTGTAGEVECYLSEVENFNRKPLGIDLAFILEKSSGLHNIGVHSTEDKTIPTTAAIVSNNNNEQTAQSAYTSQTSAAALNVLGRHDTEYILMTRESLDRELKSTYFIYLTCHDQVDKFDSSSIFASSQSLPTPTSLKRLSSTKLLKINILDENDNGPQFDRLRYEVKILENSVENTELIKLNAIDKDEENHIAYRFAQSTDQFIQNYTDMVLNLIQKYFKLESKSGSIKTTSTPLDREARDTFLIPVIAYDEEYPSRTSHAWISVQVGDVNDNTPVLTGNTTFWIDEEGTTIDHLTTSGSSGGSSTIPSKHYQGSYQIFVGRLTGEDQDIGENGQINFKLGINNSNGLHNRPKWILRSDGMLFVQSTKIHNTAAADNRGDDIPSYFLDRETTPVYEIPIIVSDLGKNPTRSSTATVTVSLRDINDNSPRFLKPSLHNLNMSSNSNFIGKNTSQSLLSIPKGLISNIPSERINILRVDNSNPGALIYTVQAIDPDEGDNGKVVYKLDVYKGYWQLTHNSNQLINKLDRINQSSSDYFIIHQNSGEIRLNKAINVDNLQKLPECLIIFAEDCGIPPRRNYAFLFIDITTHEEGEEGGPGGEGIKQTKLNSQSINNNNTGDNLNSLDRFINISHSNNKEYKDKLNRIHFSNNLQSKLLTVDGIHMYPHSNSLSSTSKMKYTQSANTIQSSSSSSPSSLFSKSNDLSVNNDDSVDGVISNFQILMNNGESEPVSTYHTSAEMITGLGIGLVIIILVCLLLLVTYAIHGTQNIRLTRGPTQTTRTKVNGTLGKQYRNVQLKGVTNTDGTDQKKCIDQRRKWKQLCSAMRFSVNSNASMNNEKIPEDIVETMNPSKVYIFNQNKNTPYEVHSAAMHIPSSNIWESYHSDYNATDPLKKFIHEKMFAYPNQTIQPKGSVYYTQLNKFSPVINSVEMGSLSGQSCSNASSDPVNNGDQTHNNTLMRTTAIVDDSNDNSNNNNNNKLLLTNIPDHETTANQTTDSKSNHPARNYAVCANGIISVSDYMTLSLHDTHNHQCTTKNMTPTNCHFLMNAINFDQLNNNNGNNNQLTRNSSPYIDHKHQHSHVPLINTVCQQNHQHHYPHSCTPPGQRCQTMSTMSRKSPNLLKHCTLHTPVVDYTTNSKTEIISSIKGRTQIKTSMNEPNNNDNNNKEGEENENDGGCIPHAEEEEEHNEECFKTSALKSGSFV